MTRTALSKQFYEYLSKSKLFWQVYVHLVLGYYYISNKKGSNNAAR